MREYGEGAGGAPGGAQGQPRARPPGRQRVTLRDVAKRAGVSPAVVSYVINNGPRATSSDARARVLKAISDLSYHPNASARGLRAQRTHTIGFVIHDFHPLDAFVSPYTGGILTGLTGALKSREHYVLIYPSAIGEDLRGLNALLCSRRLDGVVVRLAQDPPATDALLDVIAAAHVPCVCIERPGAARFAFESVTYDDEGGAYAATRYLLARDHRRIGYLQGDLRYVSACKRLDGYRRALAESGLSVDERLIQGHSWAVSGATADVRRLLDLADPPTAIFAASDSLAFSAIEVLRERGYRVPDDIAVIGFDDTLVAQEMRPPLTTMRIPLADVGRLAADLVLGRDSSADDSQGASHVLPLELIRRGTA